MNKLAQQLLESALPVRQRERQVMETDLVCPHCNEVIGEKAIYSEMVEGETDRYGLPVYRDFHRGCGGEIEMPKNPDHDKIMRTLGFSPLEEREHDS